MYLKYKKYKDYPDRVYLQVVESYRLMLLDLGVQVSAGTINLILTKLNSEFTEDLDSAEKSALIKKNVAYIDETGARFKGLPAYTFGISNEYFTRLTTCLRKKKENALSALGKESDRIKLLISDDGTNLRGVKKNLPSK